MTRILFLADINSPHTQKWALSLAEKGFEIGIFSLSKPYTDWFKTNKNIECLTKATGSDVAKKKELGKLAYIGAVPALKRAIGSFKPDILHAHYATSYGMLGALSGFHPFVISVWGSDVYEFPNRSALHKFILKQNLKKADCLMSTSHVMAEELAKYTSHKIEITPFGVDLNVFKPQKIKTLFNEGDIVIGTIKSLEPVYGIKYLIEAFCILCTKHKDWPLKLLIVGGGLQEQELKNMVAIADITDKVIFTGRVPSGSVHEYHNMLDVYVALSDSESFGVAVVEASACGKPVVVSNVSGFVEVVENGATGLIVPVRSAKVAANAIERIISDKELAKQMGVNGRKRVEEMYNWSVNLEGIIKIYSTLLNK
ncbi:MAG TPA: glycosyltransferase [Bacteroidia bacterium]|nr:glycosyltransferase [Bacteroidia bacterium]